MSVVSKPHSCSHAMDNSFQSTQCMVQLLVLGIFFQYYYYYYYLSVTIEVVGRIDEKLPQLVRDLQYIPSDASERIYDIVNRPIVKNFKHDKDVIV